MQGKADFEVRQEIVGKPTLSIVIASHSHPALAGWLGCEPPNLGNRFNGFVATAKPLKRLMSDQCSELATQLKQCVNEKSTHYFLAHGDFGPPISPCESTDFPFGRDDEKKDRDYHRKT